MSAQHKFFDEETQTQLVGQNDAVIRLRSLVDLETEIHVTNLQNNLSGSFRVVWVNTTPVDGFHTLGAELLASDGEIWPVNLLEAGRKDQVSVPQAVLECQRCRENHLTPVPETEREFLGLGFRLARHCEVCKSTTPWAFLAETLEEIPVDVEIEDEASRENQRAKGRAPISMRIKVIRRFFGTPMEDICETQNVSRGGALFITQQAYEVNEEVEVILPYKEGDVSIPVPARVVRVKPVAGSATKGVAIRLLQAKG